MFKTAGIIISTLVTVFLLVWLIAGPGWEIFYPIIHDLFIRMGNIQFPSPS